MDVEIDTKIKRSFHVEVNDLEMVSSFNDRRKMSLFASEKSNVSNVNGNIIYEQKNKKNKRTESISTYKEFSEKFNNRSYFSEYDIKIEKIEYDINNPYEEAIEFLEIIKDYKTPLEKLTIIALESALITISVNNFWRDKKKLSNNFLRIDADQLLSIYLYIIFKMNTDTIYTQLDFIQNFIGIASKQSMVGYFFTTVDGCIKFIMSVKSKADLALNSEEKEI